MEALRVGGLVSGLDTNGIIDSMMEAAKAPINRLNTQVSELTFEKKQYNEIITMLNDMKTALLPLKMESTFKSKNTASSLTSVGSATASTNTPPGSYTLKVDTLASPAYASSIYLNKALVKLGAGVKAFGSNVYPYDQVEGKHTVTVKDGGSKWIATDVFESKNGQKYTKNISAAMKSTGADAIIDGNGKTTSAIDEEVEMIFSYNGSNYAAKIKLDYPANTYTSTIAQDLEKQINASIDANFAKDGRQTVAVRTEYNETDGTYKFGFYDVSSSAKIDIGGFKADPATTPAPTKFESLGLAVLGSPVETTKIISSLTSNNATNLQTKITDSLGGFFPGATLQFETTGLTEGTFEVYQDSSANSRQATKSRFEGDKSSKILSTTTDEDLQKWLNASLSSTTVTSFFETAPTADKTNGYVHINGVKIDINMNMKPNEIMAKINGSGANVTATFDFETKTFRIESNVTGAGDVTLGKDGDTSNLFDIMQVSIPSGSTYIRGQSEGNISTSSLVKDAGFTIPVGTGVFTINGVAIYVDSTKDTVEDVVKKVNRSGAGVTMSYDQNTDKFMLTSKTAEKIKVGAVGDTTSFLQAAGIAYNVTSESTIGQEGKDAVFTLNGTQYVRKSNEVSDVVAGMTLSLVGEGTTVISVKIDTDRAVDAMAGFAAKYNEIINKLNPTAPSKDDREKYSEPLTDDAKKNMSEDEVKAYQKSHEHIQYYDIMTKSSELKSLKMAVRDNVFNKISIPDNQFQGLSSMGILTAGADTQNIAITKLGLLIDVSTDKDELAKYLKESTKFTQHVANSSDEVFDFFAAHKETSTTANGVTTKKLEYQGWSRNYDTFILNNTTATSALQKKAGTNGTIDQNINTLKQQIETQTKRAEAYLERMWAQFSAMEQRVQSIQSQASYLNQIGGGSAK